MPGSDDLLRCNEAEPRTDKLGANFAEVHRFESRRGFSPRHCAIQQINQSPDIALALGRETFISRFIIGGKRDFRIWHLASFRCDAEFGPPSADCVEKLENRGSPKISQVSHVGDFSRCKAL